jgi:hypothetical protein
MHGHGGRPVLEDVATTERKRNCSESFKEFIRSSFPLATRSIADCDGMLETVRSSKSPTAVAVLIQILRRSRISRPASGPSAIHSALSECNPVIVSLEVSSQLPRYRKNRETDRSLNTRSGKCLLEWHRQRFIAVEKSWALTEVQNR